MEIFDRIHHPDSLINRIQDKLTRVINAIARVPLLDGVLLEGVAIDAAATVVPHSLGRTPRGYICLDAQANQIGQIAPADDKFLYVAATSPLTTSFWVF